MLLKIWIGSAVIVSFSNAASFQRDYYSSQREGDASAAAADPTPWSNFRNNPIPPNGGEKEVVMLGDETAALVQRQQNQPSVPPPPRVDLNHMALTLRFTAEMNRRLAYGTSHPTIPRPTFPHSLMPATSNHHSVALEQRGGTATVGTPTTTWEQQASLDGTNTASSGPVNVHPSRQWQRSIPASLTPPRTELTLFHAKSARKTKNNRPRGCCQWGPDLELYLRHLTEALEIKEAESPIVLVLTMIYMDRACSVETHRSNQQQQGNAAAAAAMAVLQHQKCPNVTPRTVHRLSVVAMVIAHKAVHGGTTEEHWSKLEALGIPLEQFQQMESWMMQALGVDGLFVPQEHLYQWLQAWHETFTREKPQQQQLLVHQ